MKSAFFFLVAISAASVAIAIGVSLSAAAQAQCPFYMTDCTIASDSDSALEETELQNVTAVINTASISVRNEITRLDLLTQQVNGTFFEVIDELMLQVDDIERDETELFVVDKSANETLAASDFDDMEEILREKIDDFATSSNGTEMLNISIIQFVNDTSSSLTVDLLVTDSSFTGDYSSYAACQFGHWVSSGFNATLTERKQTCLQ